MFYSICNFWKCIKFTVHRVCRSLERILTVHNEFKAFDRTPEASRTKVKFSAAKVIMVDEVMRSTCARAFASQREEGCTRTSDSHGKSSHSAQLYCHPSHLLCAKQLRCQTTSSSLRVVRTSSVLKSLKHAPGIIFLAVCARKAL